MTINFKGVSIWFLSKVFAFALVTLLASCNQSNANSTIGEKKDIARKCKRDVNIGGSHICLPEINGMTECFDEFKNRDIIQSLNKEENRFFSYYMNDSIYDIYKNNEITQNNDFFTMFIPYKIENYDASIDDVIALNKALKSNYVNDNWDRIKIKLDYNPKLTFSKPILIESYEVFPKVESIINISSFRNGNREVILLNVGTVCLINNRLVMVNYYKIYEGQESIKIAKSKSDYIIYNLMSENGVL
jgi:hypothetical protein